MFRVSDDVATFGRGLIDRFIKVADKQSVRYLLKTKSPEGAKTKTITEVGRLMKETRRKYSGATIQFPTVNYHTNKETTTMESAEKIIEYLHTLDGEMSR